MPAPPTATMKCRLCGEPAAIEFLNLGQQPLANKYPTQAEFAAEDFFPLQVFFCPTCKNVQLGTIVSRERMFEDYYYLSSVNRELVRHFEDLAQQLASAHFVVDVGSNDGILLKPLQKLGVKALGVEPSINVSKIANDQGLETLTTFFDIPAAEKIEESYGRADVIVASSVFTHLENPSGFIEAVKRLLTDDGTFIIEVEYIGAILATTQFERFYLDRIFYYSLTSLAKLFAAHGMFIADVREIVAARRLIAGVRATSGRAILLRCHAPTLRTRGKGSDAGNLARVWAQCRCSNIRVQRSTGGIPASRVASCRLRFAGTCGDDM